MKEQEGRQFIDPAICGGGVGMWRIVWRSEHFLHPSDLYFANLKCVSTSTSHWENKRSGLSNFRASSMCNDSSELPSRSAMCPLTPERLL